MFAGGCCRLVWHICLDTSGLEQVSVAGRLSLFGVGD